jgi:hypothetical protein|nr:hypothetical protein [Kofleriaceae bacterium]
MKLGAALIVIVVAAACGGSPPPPAAPPAQGDGAVAGSAGSAVATPGDPPGYPDDVMAAMAQFRDEVCVCATKPLPDSVACARTENDNLVKWAASHASQANQPPDDPAKLAEISHQLSDCLAKITSAAQPPSDGGN